MVARRTNTSTLLRWMAARALSPPALAGALVASVVFVEAGERVLAKAWAAGAPPGVLDVHLVLYAPFFLAGACVAAVPNGLRRLSARLPIGTVLVTAAALCLTLLMEVGVISAPTFLRTAIHFVSAAGSIRCLFALSARIFTAPSPVIARLVDSALVVYLVHHPFVILFSALGLAAAVPPLIGFAVTVLLTLVVSLLVSEVVLSRRATRFMFTGRGRSESGSLCSLLRTRFAGA